MMQAFSVKSFLRGVGFALLTVLAAAAVLVGTSTLLLAGEAKEDPVFSETQQTVIETLDEYAGFAPYDAGIILPEQITPDVFGDFTFIDTRNAEAFGTATISGAQNIEWRAVFARVDEIPTDRQVVLFCDTGALSAQSAFGLRALGYENVLILQTGFRGWQDHQASLSN